MGGLRDPPLASVWLIRGGSWAAVSGVRSRGNIIITGAMSSVVGWAL